jgi:glycosyltransferase involved in cell wall biosynthesis
VLAKLHLKKRYDLIHVHSVPDFEVVAALLPKLLGAKVILDIHDIVPEFYASKFRVNPDSLTFKALVLVERISARLADRVIISNHLWYNKIVSRSVAAEKCSTILNYPDPTAFRMRRIVVREGKARDKLILLYPGTFGWHQGLDVAIRAFSIIAERAGGVDFHIYGDGSEKGKIQDLIAGLRIGDRVFLMNSVPHSKIGDVMACADIGVVPKRNNMFAGEAFSTKILEFMAVGVPVIVSETAIDRFYFNHSIVHFFKPEDENDLARAMLSLIENREARESLAARASEFVRQYTWDKKKEMYLTLVDSLIGKSQAPRLPVP